MGPIVAVVVLIQVVDGIALMQERIDVGMAVLDYNMVIWQGSYIISSICTAVI